MQLVVLGCFSILAMKRFLNFYVVIVEKRIVDALRKETEFCWELILTFLTLKFGQRVFGSLFFTTWSKVAQHTDREVKLRLFSHLHALSLRWHLERKVSAYCLSLVFTAYFLLFSTDCLLPTSYCRPGRC